MTKNYAFPYLKGQNLFILAILIPDLDPVFLDIRNPDKVLDVLHKYAVTHKLGPTEYLKELPSDNVQINALILDYERRYPGVTFRRTFLSYNQKRGTELFSSEPGSSG